MNTEFKELKEVNATILIEDGVYTIKYECLKCKTKQTFFTSGKATLSESITGLCKVCEGEQ